MCVEWEVVWGVVVIIFHERNRCNKPSLLAPQHNRGLTSLTSLYPNRMLKFEVSDGKGGRKCPIPDELKRFPVWAGCGEWAYASHPKGFRSSFGFNTNIWLAKKFERVAQGRLELAGGKGKEAKGKEAKGKEAVAKPASADDPRDPLLPQGRMRVSGQASLFRLDQDMKVWKLRSVEVGILQRPRCPFRVSMEGRGPYQ